MDKFLQVPKALFDPSSKYFSLSNSAKIIYILMIDRYKLSMQNFKKGDMTYWSEEYNRCFIYYNIEELIKISNIKAESSIIKAKKELMALKLIEQRKYRGNLRIFVFPPVTDNNIEENSFDVESYLVSDAVKHKDSKRDVLSDIELKSKWYVNDDCNICDRLFKLFRDYDDKDKITAEEFWYLRNNIQVYESSNVINNFKAFVRSLRRSYREQKDYVLVHVGKKTSIDIENEIISARNNKFISDEDNILSYDWLNN